MRREPAFGKERYGIIMAENKQIKRDDEWQAEKKHLDECRKLIASNIEEYKRQYEKMRKETKALFNEVQGGNVELYDQLLTSRSLEEHSLNRLNNNRAAYDKPFFGRIDYRNLSEKLFETVYIGKHGVMRDKVNVEIVDWRAPVSTVYYENELGAGSYSTPESSYDIDLKLKRTFDIEDGALQGYYDSDVAANDELLVKYLSKNRDAVLGDIIATIQKEQNEIIRESPFRNIIVQGVAGSGKTTVAMHRISYIMYNYKERFTSNEFCIVGGSDLLIDYITGGLPELEVYDVKHMRMDGLLTYLLKKEWKKKYKLVPPQPDLAWKSKMLFAEELENYLWRMRRKLLDGCEVSDDEIGMLLSRNNNETFIADNPDYSINRLLTVLDERLKSRIKLQCVGREEVDIYKRKLAQYRNYFKAYCYKGDVVSIYLKFLQSYGAAHDIDVTRVSENISGGCFDIYDVAAMLIIYYRVLQKKPDEEFGQMFIDEAQDFGAAVYYALRTVLPECFFTVMGDVSQNVNYECGMNDWDDMREKVFCGEKDCFKLLAKSYRNTIEISEFAGKVLESASKGAYKIEPVIRHGEPVHFIDSISLEETAGICAETIESMLKKGYETIAVICFDDVQKAEAEKRIGRLLADSGQTKIKFAETDKDSFGKGVTVLTVPETKGLEFDCVVLWRADFEECRENPKAAKLMYVAVTRALHELFAVGSDKA